MFLVCLPHLFASFFEERTEKDSFLDKFPIFSAVPDDVNVVILSMTSLVFVFNNDICNGDVIDALD